MKVFLQKHQGEFVNVNIYTAFRGFQDRGYETLFFASSEINSLPLDENSLVVGGIPQVLIALRQLGIEPPALPSIPEALLSYAKRRVWTSTLGEVRSNFMEGQRVFIKPLPADRKLFTGQVISSFRDLIETASLPLDYPVLCSEPIDFRAEYRAFVMDGEIIGLRYYTGDFRLFPDYNVIASAVVDYPSAPAAYSIDFGVSGDGTTILVEINDAYALGCYGLSPSLYSALIERRWQELLQLHHQARD